MQIENIENSISYTLNIRPLYSSDNKLFGIVEEIINNTEAKKIIDEIRIRDSILASSINAIAVADLDGILTYVNSSFLEMWGCDIKWAMSKPITDFWQMGSNPADALSFLYKRGKWVSEGVISKKDGSISYIQILASIVIDETDTPICIVTSFIDITGQKKSEEVRERLSKEIIEKNNELEQMIRIVSHDLRSPLVNIQGFSNELDISCKQVCEILGEFEMPDDLTEKLTPILNEDIPEILGYILVSVSKIDTLLSGLLRISRLGRASINIEGLDMNELLSNVIGTFEFQLKHLGINLIVDDLPSCIGDEAQINQVFSNLMNNAIKYLDPNKKGFIQISGYEKNGRIIYSVEDNGIGISPEHQEKIFDLFYRLDPKSTSGEGLGLNIIRKILDRHDGKVWVESEYGKGSKFYISLPNRQKMDSPKEY